MHLAGAGAMYNKQVEQFYVRAVWSKPTFQSTILVD